MAAKKPCNCRNGLTSKYYVFVPVLPAFAQVPACLGVQQRPDGHVYLFGDQATAANFARFVESSYGVACRTAKKE